MFTQFFYLLKKRKVPVSITEWLTLMETLVKGHIGSLEDFYYLARAILVKSEAYYDQYDVAFQEYFKGIEPPPEIREEILDWLKDPLNQMLLTEDERALLDTPDFQKLLEEFAKRLQEQTSQHDGGGYWIGRGGTSPFGHSGRHPAGIRIGGQSGGGRAFKIAQERRFRNYRHDVTLDVRQIKLALKGLRQLSRIGPMDELDLEKTIDATAKNAGDIELLWRRRRKNAMKLLLLMDVGGSMEPYAHLCNRLFSAAHSASHFKDFRYYYFHNCIYDNLYTDIERSMGVAANYILNTFESDCKVVLVGDARMAIYELIAKYGSISYYEQNETPGIEWLKRIAGHFSHCIWLNPVQRSLWNHPSVMTIARIFPMFELTLDGLDEGVKKLVVKR
ncbi:VWA domain-containing protein [Chloroflexota bacterium]